MRKLIVLLIVTTLCVCCGASADGYPEKRLSGVVQWGAGGGTDSLARPLCALAEDALGAGITVSNKPGGSGSIAAQFVLDARADGYTLLLGAENPALYSALGISDITYDDFDCVLLIGDETTGLVVGRSSRYDSFAALIEDALSRPGEITMATTGVGGLPWEMGAFITHITGASFNQIPYDSDATARTAVISGECAFTICKLQTGVESHKAGDIRYLTLFDTAQSEALPGVSIVTDEYPAFADVLPWGPFYGVFVKKGTDAAVVDTLATAFKAAFDMERYQTVLRQFHVNALGLSGEDAARYIQAWQAHTISALTSSGAIAAPAP